MNTLVLGLSASAYGFGAGIFFLAYSVFEVPSNLLLAHFGARRWIARIMFTWGITSGAMALIGGEAGFLRGAFLLGAAEAGFPLRDWMSIFVRNLGGCLVAYSYSQPDSLYLG